MRSYTLTEKQLESLKRHAENLGEISQGFVDGQGINVKNFEECMGALNDARELKYLIEDAENQPAAVQWVEDVKEFRRCYEINTPAKTAEEVRTQFKCVREEFFELFDELCESDFRSSVKVLDGICDLLYTTIGLALSLGCDVEGAFAEVQRSNMTKLGADGKPIYREDGKVLKGPNFEPPQLEPYLPKEASDNA